MPQIHVIKKQGYFILHVFYDCCRRKNRKKRPLDLARMEQIEKFLSQPANRLTRHNSLPRHKRVVERELRVPQ
jgi:hypothetical protein